MAYQCFFLGSAMLSGFDGAERQERTTLQGSGAKRAGIR